MKLQFILLILFSSPLNLFSQGTFHIDSTLREFEYYVPMEHVEPQTYFLTNKILITEPAEKLEQRGELFSENAAKRSYNIEIGQIRFPKSIKRSSFSDRICLFQSVVDLRKKVISHVYYPTDSTHFYQKAQSSVSQSFVYNDYLEREVLFDAQADSILITNWYIKHYNKAEIREITVERDKIQHQMDSVHQLMVEAKINGAYKWSDQMLPFMSCIDSLHSLVTHIDLMQTHSIQDSVERLIENEQPLSKVKCKGRGNAEVVSFDLGDKDEFLQSQFKLRFGRYDGFRDGKNYFFSENLVYTGEEIIHFFIEENLYAHHSGWDSDFILDQNGILQIQQVEQHIGETYHYIINNTFWFEELKK